ncbi:hypothetical protein GCM10010191_39880 [Actinomadura vinacea]|uniref:DUF4351 domain-containing protein n=1 Tax=Actinomadura vinacea TaxID=115336 RepID=A0ABN3J790_9ACTN
MRTQTRYFSEPFRRAYAEGYAEGYAKGILWILDQRRVGLTEEQRRRIRGCTDPEEADAWGKRVLDVSSADELFAG